MAETRPQDQRFPTAKQAVVITVCGFAMAFFGCLGAISVFERSDVLGYIGIGVFVVGSLAFLASRGIALDDADVQTWLAGGESIVGVAIDGALAAVTLDDGHEVNCELAVAGIGVKPVTDVLAGSGIEVNNGVLGSETEATSTSAADTGNTFRYDAAGGQYIYNLASGILDAPATYVAYVREAHSLGVDGAERPTPGESSQEFALK